MYDLGNSRACARIGRSHFNVQKMIPPDLCMRPHYPSCSAPLAYEFLLFRRTQFLVPRARFCNTYVKPLFENFCRFLSMTYREQAALQRGKMIS